MNDSLFFLPLSFDSMATTCYQSSSIYSTVSSAPTQQQPSSTYSFVHNIMPNRYPFITRSCRQSSSMRSDASDQAPDFPPSPTSIESTQSKPLLPIVAPATATSSTDKPRSFSVASELGTPNASFYSFAQAGAKKAGVATPNVDKKILRLSMLDRQLMGRRCCVRKDPRMTIIPAFASGTAVGPIVCCSSTKYSPKLTAASQEPSPGQAPQQLNEREERGDRVHHC